MREGGREGKDWEFAVQDLYPTVSYFLTDFQQIYDRLGVTIIERGESYYQPVMPDIVNDLEAKGKPL